MKRVRTKVALTFKVIEIKWHLITLVVHGSLSAIGNKMGIMSIK